jgi:hypothetical protein
MSLVRLTETFAFSKHCDSSKGNNMLHLQMLLLLVFWIYVLSPNPSHAFALLGCRQPSTSAAVMDTTRPPYDHYTNWRHHHIHHDRLYVDRGRYRGCKQPLFAIPDKYSESEMSEMRDLIISLSLEPTDHDRRSRVQQIFHETLETQEKDSASRFCDLFDMVLIQVGDQVQMEAKKSFFENSVATQGDEDKDKEILVGGDNDDGDGPRTEADEGSRVKSKEELQLWGLIDMMVQSKTIVKRHNGELGSKGAFQ